MRHIYQLAGLLFLSSSLFGQDSIRVEGLGWLGDREMKERLGFLLDFDAAATTGLPAWLLEDSAFLLLEQMQRQGHLRPGLEGRFLSDGEILEIGWEVPYEVQLPIDYVADEARFLVRKGPLYYYNSVAIEGLEGIDLKHPERFFIPGGSLFTRKKDLAYTPENLKRRSDRLLATLESMGYADAHIAAESVEIDEASGAVSLRLVVDTGRLYYTGAVEVLAADAWPESLEPIELEGSAIFNRDWVRDARLRVQHAAFKAGYAEAVVDVQLMEPVERADGAVQQPVRLILKAGPRYDLAGIRFAGDPKTKESVLRRQTDLKPGAPLDPREADRARRRLMGLGIYQQVEMSFVPQGEGEQTILYNLRPGTLKELQLAGGWGSYEQARAGFRWTHRNPFGRAHRYSLRAKQSFKATRVQSSYHVPQLFGTNFEAYSEIEYNQREEISFDRSKQGGLVGLSSLLGASGWRLAMEYGWFAEEADDIAGSNLGTEADAFVASLGLRLSLDRRDNALAPTEGYDVFADFKTAHEALGGNVTFQRVQVGGSYHLPLSSRTIGHLGLRGGWLLGEESELPFGERFFQGGENTVRGYREGEASPLNLAGEPVGAEAFWRANLEVEERLFRDVSLVAFLDAVGVSRDGGFTGEHDVLSSVGLGLRYHTVVGPLRLEYGHNLNPRARDRSGMWHFSIGYPF